MLLIDAPGQGWPGYVTSPHSPYPIPHPSLLPPPPPLAISLVPQLETITAPFFPSLAELGEFRLVAVDDMPANYQTLLAHDAHMTVTVEAFHKSLVDVQVLDERREGDFYSRTSLLICQSNRRIAQFGIMRIDLSGLPAIVRDEIESRGTPLGRILIQHNVLRHVELHRLWRIAPGPVLRRRLINQDHSPQHEPSAPSDSAIGMAPPPLSAITGGQSPTVRQSLYGRTARIVVEGRPAVELLEIVKA